MSNKNHHLLLRGETWYFIAWKDGKQIKKSLKTKNVLEARQRRIEELAKLKEGADAFYENNASKQAKYFPTIKELIDSFMRWVDHVNLVEQGPSLKTAKDLRGFFIRMLCARYGFQPNSSGKAYEIPERIANLPITEVNKQLPLDYQQYFWKEARKRGAKSSSTKISVASAVRQARALFAEKSSASITPMEWYESEGLAMPDCIKGFKAAASKFRDRAAPYKKPPQDLINRTLAAAEALKAENPTLGTAFVLAYDLGLRAAESAWAKWEWFEPRDDGSIAVNVHAVARIVGQEKGFAPKASTVERPGRTIAIPRETYEYLLANRHTEPQMVVEKTPSKLTFAKAEEIRLKFKRGRTKNSIAKEYEISHTLVRQVVQNEKWTAPRNPANPLENGEYVLQGLHFTARYRLVEDELNAWLRDLGWTKNPGVGHQGFEKASHELRKLMGSEYYVRLGSVQAKNFLGHASVSTTEHYYAALGVDQVQALYPEALPDKAVVKFA